MYLHSLSLLFILILGDFQKASIQNTEQLIGAMHKQYKGKWAKSLTFVQHNTHYESDSVAGKSVWYEAISYPDKFRIDFGKPTAGDAVIFAEDSMYRFKEGELKAKRHQPNDLLLVAGGINFMDKEQALKRLKEAGYDVTKFHEDVWEGKPVYVVGADKGDVSSNQFWIDKDKLILLRTITKTPTQQIQVQEARFSKHIKTAGGWTETEVLFLMDGKEEQLEEYKNIKVNPTLSPGLFRPDQFGKAHWMSE